jgi:hypothetical protein
VDRGATSEQGVNELERALALGRSVLADCNNDDERSRRSQAIDELSQYVDLLRVATAGAPAPEAKSAPSEVRAAEAYWFKFEFADGRWDIDEKELQAAPHVGDVYDFSDSGKWRVRASQFVKPRPSQKPMREFFVCAPAA